MAGKNSLRRSRPLAKPKTAGGFRATIYIMLMLLVVSLVSFALGVYTSPSLKSGRLENQSRIFLTEDNISQPEAKTPYVSINFSSRSIRFLNRTAPPDKRYLMLELEIENNGYHIFDTNPLYWSLTINNTRYSASLAETLTLENRLESKNLHSGEKTNGSIIYLVPAGNITYQVVYRGAKDFNITWKHISEREQNS